MTASSRCPSPLRLATVPLFLAAVTVVVGSCKPLAVDDVRLVPTTFSAVGPQSISGTVGQTLTSVGEVRVLDQDGDPMEGQTVTFSASGGSLAGANAVTSANGLAKPTSWTLPTVTGTASLTASLPGSNRPNVTFTATLSPGTATTIVRTDAANNQTAAAGASVAVAPSVRTDDQYGNPVPGTSVTFTAVTGTIVTTVGGGSVTSGAVTTNSSGVAQIVSWTLSSSGGTQTLRAALTSNAAVLTTFTATGVTLPSAPSSLTATAVSTTQINLSWTDNAGNEDGFRIERCTGASCSSFSEIATVVANITTYQSTGLSAGTTYGYRVRAYNIAGNSSYSNTASATTTANLPDLVITAFSAPPVAKIGSSSSISVTVTNQGGTSVGAFQVGIYFSTNNIISTGDTPSSSVCAVSSLAAGASFTCSGPASVPSSLTAGSWFAGAYADNLFAISESNEANNNSTADAITLANAELVANGDFEAATNIDWILSGTASGSACSTCAIVNDASAFSRSGTKYAYLGATVSSTGTMYQDIVIPAGAISPSLTFYTNITTNESTSSTTQWDVLTVTVRTTSGTVLGTLLTLSNLNFSAGTGSSFYTVRTFSLSAYVGQTIRLYFNATNDTLNTTTFRIDDVSISWTAP